MDDDQIADIFNYFKDDAETDSMEEAIAELGDDYEVTEIRLVRIKFLAEMGN
jgi:ATP-dependent DNA helicase RecQ